MSDLQKLLPPGPVLDSLGGCRVLSVDVPRGVVRLEFTARPEFCHSNGTTVQGGYVTAWMDFAMAFATMTHSRGRSGVATLDISVRFLQRVGPGQVIAEGRVVRLGRRVAFLEASLFDTADRLLATASSGAMVIEPVWDTSALR